MELTFTNLVLIIFMPVAFIAVLLLFITPFYVRLFDRDRAIKKQMAESRKALRDRVREEIKEFHENVDQGANLPKEKESLRADVATLLEEHAGSFRSTFKELVRVHNEDSGFTDTIKEWKVEGWRSAHMYLASIMFTPATLLLFAATGLDLRILALLGASESFASQYPLLVYLVLPAGGIWLAFRGHALYQSKSALRVALLLNACYAISISYAGIANKPN